MELLSFSERDRKNEKVKPVTYTVIHQYYQRFSGRSTSFFFFSNMIPSILLKEEVCFLIDNNLLKLEEIIS